MRLKKLKKLIREKHIIDEDGSPAPVASQGSVVGQGLVAGLGVGPQGEPPGKTKKSPVMFNVTRRKLPRG